MGIYNPRGEYSEALNEIYVYEGLAGVGLNGAYEYLSEIRIEEGIDGYVQNGFGDYSRVETLNREISCDDKFLDSDKDTYNTCQINLGNIISTGKKLRSIEKEKNIIKKVLNKRQLQKLNDMGITFK